MILRIKLITIICAGYLRKYALHVLFFSFVLPNKMFFNDYLIFSFLSVRRVVERYNISYYILINIDVHILYKCIFREKLAMKLGEMTYKTFWLIIE